MNVEEAKKIAEAIAVALVKRPQGFSIESIKDQCVEILTADPAAPVEKEYRAGEWVPTFGVNYWYSDAVAAVDWDIWQGDTIVNVRLLRQCFHVSGNAMTPLQPLCFLYQIQLPNIHQEC